MCLLLISRGSNVSGRRRKINVDASLSSYIEDIVEHPETVLQNPSSLFILPIPILEAERIQKSYGVLKSIDQMTATLRSFSNWTRRISLHTSYDYALNGEWQERCEGMKNRIII